ESGELHTPHIVAEATMTLAAPKTALAGADAAVAVGRLLLADISVPGRVYGRLGLAHDTPFRRGSVVELAAEGERGSRAPGHRAQPCGRTAVSRERVGQDVKQSRGPRWEVTDGPLPVVLQARVRTLGTTRRRGDVAADARRPGSSGARSGTR